MVEGINDPQFNRHDIVRRDPRAGIGLLSGTIAYFLMFAVVPAFTALVLLYSVALNPQTLQSTLAASVRGLPQSEALLLQGLLNNILNSSSSQRYLGGLISLLFALWGVLGGADALVESIGMYTTAPPVGFVRQKWRAFLVAIHLFVAVSATVGSIVLMAGVKSFLPALAGIGVFAVSVAGWLVLFAILAWLFSSIYRVAGVRAPHRGGVSKGGASAAFTFVIVSVLFGIYIKNFGKYNATYGALAGLVVLLLWLRIAAASLLWGSGRDEKGSEPELQGARSEYVQRS
jgi:membrane protein